MSVDSAVILMICVFAFVPLFLAEFARNNAIPTISDFFLQSRKMHVFPMYSTIFATWMSAFAFMGAIIYFNEKGPVYMTTIGWDALFAILFYIIGRRIWFYGKKFGYITAVDFFEDIYGSKILSFLVSVIMLAFTLVYTQVQMVGGLFLIQTTSGGYISWELSGLLFFVILVIYLWAGGLRAVALADTFYGILIIVSVLLCGFFLMNTAGGMSEMFSGVIEDDINNVTLGGENNSARIRSWLSLFILVPAGAFMGPQMWIRNYAAKSEKNFEILPLLLCISSVICVGTLFSGSASILLNTEGIMGDSLLISLILRYGNPILSAFIFIGISAAILSTANSQIHAMAAICTVDIYKKYIDRNISERKLLSVAKWSVLIVSIISYMLLFISPPNVVSLGVFSFGGMVQLIIPVLGAFFWSRSSTAGALAGLIFGIVSFFVLIRWTDYTDSVSGFISLAVNGLVFIFVSLNHSGKNYVGEKIAAYREISLSYFKQN